MTCYTKTFLVGVAIGVIFVFLVFSFLFLYVI